MKRVKKTYYKDLNGHAQLQFQTILAMINGIIESNRVNIPQYAWLVCLGAFVKSDDKKHKKIPRKYRKDSSLFQIVLRWIKSGHFRINHLLSDI